MSDYREYSAPRLEIPFLTDEALEIGARLAQWLDHIRRVPGGVKFLPSNCVELCLDHNDEDPGQCAVIIPESPLPVTREVWDYTINPPRRTDTRFILPAITDPVIVRSFELGEDWTEDIDPAGNVLIKAHSVGWVPREDNWKIQIHESYDFDPSVHKLAVVDGWDDLRSTG